MRSVEQVKEAAVDRLVAAVVSSFVPLLPPWVLGFLLWAAGGVAHALWEKPAVLPWVAVAFALVTVGLSSLAWHLSHARGRYGRIHATATMAAAGGWLTCATVAGPTQHFVLSVLLIGGPTVALTWNMRRLIRTDGVPGGDRLADLFAPHAKTVGLEDARLRTTGVGPRKVTATAELAPGDTVDDVHRAIPAAESAMGMPPGSMTATADEDRADRATVTISDPRLLKQSMAWPGAYYPGESVCKPLRVGVWQDGEYVEYVILGHHLQINGMTDAGKSIGGAWSLLGEIITRYDAAVFAADITKREQTLGPLRESLHRFEIEKPGLRDMMSRIYAQVGPRTDHLAARGLQKWAKGCGLTYWVVWLEEVPDIVDAINVDKFVSFLKAARSAGIFIVMSLQRSDWTQIPTILRSQMAKMCFGLDSSDDEEFGLTDEQVRAGAHPGRWRNNYPGMAYLDANSIDRSRIAMPLRTWDWGSDEVGDQRIREHAAQWPASAKKVCASTLAVLENPATFQKVEVVPSPQVTEDSEPDWDTEGVHDEYLQTRDPSPDNTLSSDDPVQQPSEEEDAALRFGGGGAKWPPEDARQALYAQIAAWHALGRTSFTVSDLAPVWQKTGNQRTWVYPHLRRLAAAGFVRQENGGWEIDAAPDPLVPAREDEMADA